MDLVKEMEKTGVIPEETTAEQLIAWGEREIKMNIPGDFRICHYTGFSIVWEKGQNGKYHLFQRFTWDTDYEPKRA